MSTPQEPETPEEYLKRLNEQYGQTGANPYQSPSEGQYGDPAAPYTQPGYGQAPGQPAPGAYAGPQAPPHPTSTLAMVLGLIALVGSFFTCGLTLLVGPFAWFFGARATREIDASNGAFSGRSQASAGKVMGIISVIFLVLSLIAVALFIAAVVTTDVTYALGANA